MVGACSSLAVAVFVPSVALAAPSAGSAASHDTTHVAANVVIDLTPAPGIPAWFARGFEETIARELAGFERLGTVAKQDVALGSCGADRACRLRAYRAADIDIVLFGSVADDTIAYELYQTWTPARLETGEIDVGKTESIVGLEHSTRRVFHVVLKHGGLLDQKPYMLEREAAASTTATAWTTKQIAIGICLLAFLALPFVLALLGGEAPKRLAAMRSARRVLFVIAVAIVMAVVLDPRRIGELVGASGWLVAGIGGLGWGAFLVFLVRTAFPPLDGLERVPHGELVRILATWCIAALERLAMLAIAYAPVVSLVVWLGASIAIPARWVYLVIAPAVVWLAQLWFASWVECLALRLDRRLVEGVASQDNPWSREITDYLMGYVRRTGWDLDPELLARSIFLPGKNIGGVVTYGGGPTRARIVVDRELLVMAMGPLLEDKPDDAPAHWPDWTVATIGPRPGLKLASTVPVPRARKQRAAYPGMQRKPLGQAATLLGYTMPAPGQLVPLISDNPEDLAIVRQLLSEHYPWFAPDPDEEYDATDPTDKDLLFGALVHALGTVRRNETQLSTLKLSLGTRVARWSSGVRARLADSYAALNFARHHLIQYLYYSWTKKTDLLTARARPVRLHEVSTQILREVSEPKANPSRAIAARLAWLSQFFAEPITDRRSVLVRRVAAGAVLAALLIAAGIAVKRSIEYHPIYLERMHAQEKGPVNGETKKR
ncbi:MAG: hypothetical protein JWO36_4282 [Myxococcales bacterium]|nr:hypothetical protein [Myxococcales bacterium]